MKTGSLDHQSDRRNHRQSWRQAWLALGLVAAGLASVRLALAGLERSPQANDSPWLLVAFAGGALLCLAGGLLAMVSSLRQPRWSLPHPAGNWLVVYILLLSILLPLLWLVLSGLLGAWALSGLGQPQGVVSRLWDGLGQAARHWTSTGLLLQTICLAVLVFFYLRRGTVTAVPPVGSGLVVRLADWRGLILGALVGLGLWLGAIFIQRIVLAVLPAAWAAIFPPLSLGKHASVSWLAAAALLLAAPWAEEMFFRGYVFPTWRQEFGPAWGMLASAGLYAVYTLNPVTFLPYVGLGLGLAALMQIDGRLAPAWAAHVVFNLLAFVIVWPV
jgi:membrane protease YdiL (CAAX protease family)